LAEIHMESPLLIMWSMR